MVARITFSRALAAAAAIDSASRQGQHPCQLGPYDGIWQLANKPRPLVTEFRGQGEAPLQAML